MVQPGVVPSLVVVAGIHWYIVVAVVLVALRSLVQWDLPVAVVAYYTVHILLRFLAVVQEVQTREVLQTVAVVAVPGAGHQTGL